MTGFNILATILVVFVACVAVIVLPALAAHAIEQSISPASVVDGAYPPGPSGDERPLNMAPEPSRKQLKFLEACVMKLNSKCGDNIYSSVFETATVTDGCCHQLVAMGKVCHTRLVQAIIAQPEAASKVNVAQAPRKGVQVWEGCTSLVEAASLTPSSSIDN